MTTIMAMEMRRRRSHCGDNYYYGFSQRTGSTAVGAKLEIYLCPAEIWITAAHCNRGILGNGFFTCSGETGHFLYIFYQGKINDTNYYRNVIILDFEIHNRPKVGSGVVVQMQNKTRYYFMPITLLLFVNCTMLLDGAQRKPIKYSTHCQKMDSSKHKRISLG